MIALDEDALICDFAEFYHIYDISKFPVDYVATLALGLRDNSRIKTKLSGLKVDVQTMLLAHIADNTATNVYLKTKDAAKGINRPKSLLKAILQGEEKKEYREFKSGEEFMEEWRRLNGN